MRRPVWPRVSSATVCTEISLRPDSRAGARRLFRAASATSGNVRCLEERITPRALLASERPKYGSLELVRFPDGPAPRFGSCYFVLRDVGARTSITFMGSEHPQASDRSGTLATLTAPWRHCFPRLRTAVWPLRRGLRFVRPHWACRASPWADSTILSRVSANARPNPSLGEPGRVLDTGVEAQVHGPVILNRDVELLVADPAFAGTPTGRTLNELADKYGFELQWHCGFRLPVRDVPDDFRGPVMPRFAQRVAGTSGVLDAARHRAGRSLATPQPRAVERVGRLLGRPPASQTTLARVGTLRGPHTGLNSPWGKRGLIAPGSAVWGQFPHRPNGHDSSPLRSHRTRAAMPDCRNVLFGSGRSGFPEPVAAEIHQGTVVFNRFVRRSPN